MAGLAAALTAVACGQTDSIIVNVGGSPDTLLVTGTVDTAVVTTADTSFSPADTVVVTRFDTVFSPTDTVLVTLVDTVISGTDTTFVTTVDTLITVDTVVVTTIDTVVTVDTVIVVDTVNVQTTLVASVSNLNLRVGQTAQLSVTSQNPLGFPTIPSTVAWLSDRPAIASVDNAGVARGVAAGQASIFAVASGLSVTIPTTVIDTVTAPPPPPPSALYPNRPSGMSLLTQWNGTSRTNAGWQLSSDWNNHVSVRADATNPLGTGSVLRVDFFQGSNVGPIGTINTWAGGPYNEIYFMYRIYIDPNWDESQGQKLFYWGSGGFVTAHYVTRESDLTLNVQDNLGLPTALANTDFWAGTRGTWVTLEIYARKGSSPTASDGVLRVYRNGLLRAQNTAVRSFPNAFQGMEWYMYRNGTHSRNEYFLIGELSAWGK